jgi:hypothetical protein
MREVFKPWLKEFSNQAYDVLYCMGEDGDAPSPWKGDRFFILETMAGDAEDKIIMWSAQLEGYCHWNENGWSWDEMNPEEVPESILQLNLRSNF